MHLHLPDKVDIVFRITVYIYYILAHLKKKLICANTNITSCRGWNVECMEKDYARMKERERTETKQALPKAKNIYYNWLWL